MLRKLLFTIIFVSAAAAAAAQPVKVEWGVMGGINVPDYSTNMDRTEIKNKLGWQAGLVTSLKIGWFSIDPQILYVRQGLRIRTQEAPIIMEMYKAWGATTTAIDIMELYNALQNKTVDGQENPFLSIANLRLYEVQNYMVVSSHSYLEDIMCASGQWWNGLDDATKTLIQEVVNENQQFCYDRLQEYNKEYYDTITSSDITVYELTDEERQAFKDASAPVYEIFGAEIGTDLLNRVQEFLADPANQ